jgi:hypothetical protein
MRFRDLPREFQMIAVDFLRELKLQDVHNGCAHVATSRRPGAYSRWEMNRNCGNVHLTWLDGYCKHGAWVGGLGADYMCGMCESGVTDYEWALNRAFSEWHKAQREKARIEVEAIFAFFKTVDYDTNVPMHKEMIRRATDLNIKYKVA